MHKKTKVLVVSIVLLLTGAAVVLIRQNTTNDTARDAQKSSQQTSFDTKRYSLNDPSSVWVIVNKQRPLQPAEYQPNDLVVPNVPLRLNGANEEMRLRKAPATALEEMVLDAKKSDINLMVASAYRSYRLQAIVYDGYVNSEGLEEADTQSARPGHSEHQTGLAVDLEPTNRQCEVEVCFGDTIEGKWLAANAYRYGFVMRYQQNKKNTVGYKYEPWHYRYVGKELAGELHRLNYPPLETFFGLPNAPDYN